MSRPAAGITDGRRAELVENTSARTVGSVLTFPTTIATPQSSDSWVLSHQDTRGSTSKIIVRTDSALARSSTSSSSLWRS
jgi:hypothetical protein